MSQELQFAEYLISNHNIKYPTDYTASTDIKAPLVPSRIILPRDSHPNRQSNVTLLIKQLQQSVISCDLDSLDYVISLKLKIQQLSNIPIQNQKLLFKGRVLSDFKTLSDYSIESNSTINLFKQTPTHVSQYNLTPTTEQTATDLQKQPSIINNQPSKSIPKETFWADIEAVLDKHLNSEDSKRTLELFKVAMSANK